MRWPNAKPKHDDVKLQTFCRAAALMISSKTNNCDVDILRKMLAEGIRKLHDNVTHPNGLGRGKYLGHPIWSRAAKDLLDGGEKSVNSIKCMLRHEHVIPINVVVSELIALGVTANFTLCQDIMVKRSVVAIITRAEDAKLRRNSMPDDKNLDPVWARYEEAGLHDIFCESAFSFD